MTPTARKYAVTVVLASGLLAAASFGYAQVGQGGGRVSPPLFPVPSPGQSPAPAPNPVLSGTDIGFRVEGTQGNAVTGRFVVRVNGEWRDIANTFEAKRLLTSR
jgi:hypothetical protein